MALTIQQRPPQPSPQHKWDHWLGWIIPLTWGKPSRDDDDDESEEDYYAYRRQLREASL